MVYDLDKKLVVGIASSALFDLEESDKFFREKGENAYRQYQEDNIDNLLKPGVAFPFIRRLLSLNNLSNEDEPLVEVIVLSRNDPQTGLRVLRSIKKHDLKISRAIFMQGRSPYKFIEALNISLFLSASDSDVREAIGMGFPAGQVIGTPIEDSEGDDLRVAFDFDGVIADDASEQIMQTAGLEEFHSNELKKANLPMGAGYLKTFLGSINNIQAIEEKMLDKDPAYNRRLHVALVTARNAPAHERVIQTLRSWGLSVNDAFFLGGIEKARVLRELKPHIFFDDQIGNLMPGANDIPSVHIPFGTINQLKISTKPASRTLTKLFRKQK